MMMVRLVQWILIAVACHAELRFRWIYKWIKCVQNFVKLNSETTKKIMETNGICHWLSHSQNSVSLLTLCLIAISNCCCSLHTEYAEKWTKRDKIAQICITMFHSYTWAHIHSFNIWNYKQSAHEWISKSPKITQSRLSMKKKQVELSGIQSNFIVSKKWRIPFPFIVLLLITMPSSYHVSLNYLLLLD